MRRPQCRGAKSTALALTASPRPSRCSPRRRVSLSSKAFRPIRISRPDRPAQRDAVHHFGGTQCALRHGATAPLEPEFGDGRHFDVRGQTPTRRLRAANFSLQTPPTTIPSPGVLPSTITIPTARSPVRSSRCRSQCISLTRLTEISKSPSSARGTFSRSSSLPTTAVPARITARSTPRPRSMTWLALPSRTAFRLCRHVPPRRVLVQVCWLAGRLRQRNMDADSGDTAATDAGGVLESWSLSICQGQSFGTMAIQRSVKFRLTIAMTCLSSFLESRRIGKVSVGVYLTHDNIGDVTCISSVQIIRSFLFPATTEAWAVPAMARAALGWPCSMMMRRSPSRAARHRSRVLSARNVL